MRIPITGRQGDPINSLDDWEQFASTKGKWADGFSAKELARLWLDGQGPAAIQQLLAPAMAGLRLTRAVAEAQVRFDAYDGGVRNHDVLAYGTADAGEVLIGVEGKVNESLDATLTGKYDAAGARKAKDKNTNLDKRVDDLLDAIIGRRLDTDPSLGDLHYQLFSAVAGTVAAASASTTAAAVVIHLIESPHANRKRFDKTQTAVRDFAQALGVSDALPLIGPFRLKLRLRTAPEELPVWVAVLESPSLPLEVG